MIIISGHQPVYLPWLGLFHKLSLCDRFVYMDTVQYLENDWNNRNKIRTPQGWMWLTIPIDRKKSGKMLHEIYLSGADSGGVNWQTKHWQSIETNYKKTRYFETYAEPLREVYLATRWERLIDFCWVQFNLFRRWLGLEAQTVIRMSEYSFAGNKDLLVLDHCRKLNADAVVFGTNGRNYVDLSVFRANNIKVYFQEYVHPVYEQRFSGFEPYLSLIDLMFNHGPNSIDILLTNNIKRNDLLKGGLWL